MLAEAARTWTSPGTGPIQREVRGGLGAWQVSTGHTNWWASTLIRVLSSKKLQSCIQILGQSSVTSAPPPGSPPGWVELEAHSCPCRRGPSPPANATPWSQTAGTSRGSSRAGWWLMKLELPEACAGLFCFECYLHCNRQTHFNTGPSLLTEQPHNCLLTGAPVPAPDIMQMPRPGGRSVARAIVQ